MRLNYFFIKPRLPTTSRTFDNDEAYAGSDANLNPLKTSGRLSGWEATVSFPSRRQFPTGRVFTTRGGSSIGHVAYPALSPSSSSSSSSSGECGGPKARQVVPFLPFPTGFALPLLYHSITMHAAETLVSSLLGSEVMQGAPAAGCSHGLRHAITHQRSGWNTAVAAVHGGYDNLRVRSGRVRVVPRRCDPSSWWMRRDSARSSFAKGRGGRCIEEEEEETGFSRNNTGETRVILLSVWRTIRFQPVRIARAGRRDLVGFDRWRTVLGRVESFSIGGSLSCRFWYTFGGKMRLNREMYIYF